MKLKANVKKYWEVWQNYEEKDLVYRVTLAVSAFLILVLSLSLVISSLRRPLIISVRNGVPTVTDFSKDQNSFNEEEVKVFVQEFIKNYYNWTPDTVQKRLEASLSFLDSSLKKEVASKNKEKVYDSKEKSLSQSLYVKDIIVNEKKKEVEVLAERIFTLQKVKLTNDFKVIFKLKKEKRTKENPFGLFITAILEPFDQK